MSGLLSGVVGAFVEAWSELRVNKLRVLLSLIGVAVAGMLAAYVPDAAVRLAVGVIGVTFVLWRWFGPVSGDIGIRPSAFSGVFWGALSGYASFVAHAGGPPFQIYVLPMKLDPKKYTGASIRFFAIVNAVKIIPYFLLGALGAENLTISATLLPAALVSTMLGAAIVKHLKSEVFYPMTYALALVAGVKLLWDGLPI